MKWENKSLFDSILCQQHLCCKKIPKSVDVRRSYIVQLQYRFSRHSVYDRCGLNGSYKDDTIKWLSSLTAEFYILHIYSQVMSGFSSDAVLPLFTVAVLSSKGKRSINR